MDEHAGEPRKSRRDFADNPTQKRGASPATRRTGPKRITPSQRREADFLGYLKPDPDGQWRGLLTGHDGRELVLQADVDCIGDEKRLSLIATRRIKRPAPGRAEDG